MITASQLTSTKTAPNSSSEVILFHLEDTTFGIEVLRVREILRYTPLIPITTTPGPIRGILTHLERDVPVIDMRSHFTLPARKSDRFSVILLVEIEDQRIGLDVDSVSDVIEIDHSEIEVLSETEVPENPSIVKGLVKRQDQLVILLDIVRWSPFFGSRGAENQRRPAPVIPTHSPSSPLRRGREGGINSRRPGDRYASAGPWGSPGAATTYVLGEATPSVFG